MPYQWMTKTRIRHADLENALQEVEGRAYEVFALSEAGYAPSGEPLVTVVARRGKAKGKVPRRSTRSGG